MNTFGAPSPDFDPVEHRYSYESRPYPSVTRIIDGLKLAPPYPEEDKGQKEFGTFAHKAAELAVWGRLDCSRTSPVLLPYINGLMEKVEEYKIRPIATEVLGVHLVSGYAGMLDLLCSIFDSELAIIDYKTGQPPRCVELQTAGYGELALYMQSFSSKPLFTRDKMPRRFSMQLLPNRAIVRECKDPFDYAAWNGAVTLYKWQQERRKGL